MILFALTSNASIAALFVAGILPGLLMCGGFMVVCWWVGAAATFRATSGRLAWRHVPRQEACYASPALLLPVLIMVFLRFGIATPTEVSVICRRCTPGWCRPGVPRPGAEAAERAHRQAGMATGVVLLVIMASARSAGCSPSTRCPGAFAGLGQANVSQSGW